jgi:hypothetical protein
MGNSSAVVLWKTGPVCCTCLVLPNGQIEICFIVNDITIERHRFPDAESATRYALDKMYIYRTAH